MDPNARPMALPADFKADGPPAKGWPTPKPSRWRTIGLYALVAALGLAAEILLIVVAFAIRSTPAI